VVAQPLMRGGKEGAIVGGRDLEELSIPLRSMKNSSRS
jgi:hypothetical protein